jgi:hypothetical protein
MQLSGPPPQPSVEHPKGAAVASPGMPISIAQQTPARRSRAAERVSYSWIPPLGESVVEEADGNTARHAQEGEGTDDSACQTNPLKAVSSTFIRR